MSKKNLLISAALTAFVLVILANVIAVYARTRNVVTNPPNPLTVEGLPGQGLGIVLTHQEAANIAANFLGQNDLYSAENMVWNGVDAYKVVFSSGAVVYVSLDGQILGSEAPQPVLVAAPDDNDPNSPAYQGYGDDHEDHEDHEDREEHHDRDDDRDHEDHDD